MKRGREMKYWKKIAGWVLLISIIGIMVLIPMFAIVGFKTGVLICLATVVFTIGIDVGAKLICDDSDHKVRNRK
jgi:hypothetical protein